MKFEKLLADKFLYPTSAEGEPGRSPGQPRPAVKLTTAGIALGVCVILLSFFIVEGFKAEIRTKVNGLIGSLVISNPDNVYGQYTLPLSLSEEARGVVTSTVRAYDPQASVYAFVEEMVLLKTDSAFAGVMMHGVDRAYNAGFWAEYLKSGALPEFGGESPDNEVIISSDLARRLSLESGDEVMAYFSPGISGGEGKSGGVKMRKLRVSGVFDTGFSSFDEQMILGEASFVREVRGWKEDEVSGLKAQVSNDTEVSGIYEELFVLLGERYDRYGERYTMNVASELSGGLLDWLGLLDANVVLILALLTAVAGMTMITGIIVLVLEKVKAIATLKALGERDSSLRRVFRYMALSILSKGLLWGNAAALSLGGIQYFLRPLKLDASQYYMNYVPIKIDVVSILAVNLAVFVAIYLLVLIPVVLIGNVRPSEALRFE